MVLQIYCISGCPSWLLDFLWLTSTWLVLSTSSISQESWGSGLVQGLHLTPVEPHSELCRALEKKKEQHTGHIIMQLLTFAPWILLPHMYALKKEHPPTPWKPPEPTKATHLAPPLCLLVFVTMGLPKVSYSDNSRFFLSIYPGSKWGCGHRAGKGLNTSGGQEQLAGEPNAPHKHQGCGAHPDCLKCPGHKAFSATWKHGLSHNYFTTKFPALIWFCLFTSRRSILLLRSCFWQRGEGHKRKVCMKSPSPNKKWNNSFKPLSQEQNRCLSSNFCSPTRTSSEVGESLGT